MRYVVIGASAAGISGAKTLRELDNDAEIVLVSKDEHVYSRCILHHYISNHRDVEALNFSGKDFFEKYNIHFKLHYLKRDDIYRIVLQSKSELYLLNSILYKNSHLFMSRKKNKFDHYVNTEILHKTDGDCNA